MEKTIFKEVQKFRQPWIWLIIVPAVAGGIIYFGLGINKQIVRGEPFGNQPISDAGLIIIAIFSMLIMIGIPLLFYSIKFIVEIRESGIFFRYPPLIRKEKSILKSEIDSYEVREYRPIREYG